MLRRAGKCQRAAGGNDVAFLEAADERLRRRGQDEHVGHGSEWSQQARVLCFARVLFVVLGIDDDGTFGGKQHVFAVDHGFVVVSAGGLCSSSERI